jgi:hypothetical protein
VSIILCTDEKNHFDKEKHISFDNQWNHIILTKIDPERYYRIYIDGQYISRLNQYYLYFSKMHEDDSYTNMIVHHKFDYNTLEASSRARIADLEAFNRYLTLVGIRAIH